ncbi:putative isochorismatase family protein [Lyophyllum shimeji]|uniref:Isochorismatase family protein n=1 Tax=Lyophyllum shimeji TaxID=47721 RepID=A0A9P3UKJ9_LYOSH|nr:putative isochorismatase family protein [Lyophyllum shimeji]
MSALMLPEATALLVVDVQQGFKRPPYKDLESSTPACIPNIARIIAAFRAASLPVIHIRHHSKDPSSPFHRRNCPEGAAVEPDAAERPGEPVFIKNVNSSFIGTGLEAHLRARGITTLVVVGLTTAHCVSTTVRMAGNLGWEVYLPRDATSMFGRKNAPGAQEGRREFDAQTMHEVALAELHEEFATVVTTEDIIGAVKEVGK